MPSKKDAGENYGYGVDSEGEDSMDGVTMVVQQPVEKAPSWTPTAVYPEFFDEAGEVVWSTRRGRSLAVPLPEIYMIVRDSSIIREIIVGFTFLSLFSSFQCDCICNLYPFQF